MLVAHTKWVRLGVFALPLAGLLLTVSLLVLSVTSGIAWSPDIDPRGTAAAVSSRGWPVGWSVFNAALVLVVFGSIALAAALANRRGGPSAVVAMVVSILAIALLLPFFGILAYALPPAGQAYLAGSPDALALGDASFKAALGAAVAGDLLYWAGCIVFGVAIWRAGALPRWAAVLFAIHGLLIHGPLALTVIAGVPVFALLGGALLAVAGWGIARSLWRHPPEVAAGTARLRLQRG
jgi:hypothetical protein